MKDFSYNVLWIDDQWDDKEKGNYPFILNAKTKGIDIVPYKTSKEGMKAFEDFLYKWDGIILDAKCFNESEYEVPDTDGMYNSIDKINQLSLKRFVPMYIYTGQADLLSEKHFRKSLRGKTPYVKGTDNDKLLADIIEAADKLEETRIRREFWDIFEAYPEYYKSLLFYIKNAITKENPILNDMRSFLDNNFINSFYEIGFSKKIDKLKGLANHLQGHDEKIVPDYIKKSFKNLEAKTNYGSHDEHKILTEKHPYLIRSAILDLLNILYWFKELPVDDISKDKYRSSSEKLFNNSSDEKIEGSIRINKDGKPYLSCNDNAIKPEDYGKSFVIYRNKLFKHKK